MEQYKLAVSLRCVSYAGQYYVYDAAAHRRGMVSIETRPIERPIYRALRKLQAGRLDKIPRPLEEIDQLLEAPETTQQLLALGYLEVYRSPKDRLVAQALSLFDDERQPRADDKDLKRFFSEACFFGLPKEIDSGACQVGLVGVPASSHFANLGTELAPDRLRALTRARTWFDIFTEGLYSEIQFREGEPDVIGKDVALKDFGDISTRGKTVSAFFEDIDRTVEDLFVANRVCPFFVGGDHAITYPIVRALHQRVPDLILLHLDAHNDLYYASEVSYDHAAPISNLILNTPLEKVLSFGLRTFHDARVANVKRLFREHGARDRIQFYGINHTKQLISQPEKLRDLFRAFGDRPCYLTIDLDVLSEDAMGKQLTTPAGPGLEWYELLQLVECAFAELRIIGADMVELDVSRGKPGNSLNYHLLALMLLIIDRLATQNRNYFEATS